MEKNAKFWSQKNVTDFLTAFGCGKNRKWIPIHLYSKALGEEICMGLPFWYAFTGCDTVSQFARRGKKTTWKAWTSFPRVTKTFTRLSSARELSASDLVTLERYVVLMKDWTCPMERVNECRKYLFNAIRLYDRQLPTRSRCLDSTR